MKTSRAFWKALSMALSLALVVAAFAGCSTAAPSATPAASSAATEAPTPMPEPTKGPVVPLSVMQAWVTLDNQDGIANDRIMKAIEEKLNIKITLVSMADTAPYWEKLNLFLSSGDAPDIINDAFEANFVVNAQKEGLLYDMGAAVAAAPDKYATLNKIFNDSLYKFLNNIKFGDSNKNFAIWSMSGLRNPWAGAVVYNGKLLKELNLTVPTTVDEYVTMLRAIKAAKPDVIPMGARVDKGNLIGLISPLFFRTNGAELLEITPDANGTFVDNSLGDAAKESWKLVQSLYKEGLIDQEVLTNELQTVTDRFTTGKYATIVTNQPGNNGGGLSWLIGEYKKVNADAVPGVDIICDAQPLKGKAGVANNRLPEMDVCGTNTVIYGSSKNPEKALELLNFMLSNEGQMLKWYGIEGVHYTKNADGTLKLNKEEFFKEVQIYYPGETVRYEWNPWTDLTGMNYFQFDTAADLNDAIAKAIPVVNDSYIEDNDTGKYVVPIGKAFEAAAEVMPVYETLANNLLTDDLKAKQSKVEEVKKKWFAAFLVGQKDVEAEWANYVAEVKAAGIDDLLKAKNDNVAKIKGIYDASK